MSAEVCPKGPSVAINRLGLTSPDEQNDGTLRHHRRLSHLSASARRPQGEDSPQTRLVSLGMLLTCSPYRSAFKRPISARRSSLAYVLNYRSGCCTPASTRRTSSRLIFLQSAVSGLSIRLASCFLASRIRSDSTSGEDPFDRPFFESAFLTSSLFQIANRHDPVHRGFPHRRRQPPLCRAVEQRRQARQ